MKKILLHSLLAFTLLFSVGCNVDDNSVAGYLYETSGGERTLTDQFGNTLTFTDAETEQLMSMPPKVMATFINARFQTTFPNSYSDGVVADIVNESTTPTDLTVSPTAQTAADALGYIPVWGDLASLIANGVLGVGAVWLGKRKRTAEKVNESLVRGVDVFRDVLDQTPQGQIIDEHLTEILSKRQLELGTLREVEKLLQRYATPTKKPIELPAAVSPSA